MEIVTYLNQNHYLIKLTGNIDTNEISVLNNQLEQCLETAVSAVLVDCDRVTYVCVAGLRSLLHYQKLFQTNNKIIIVFGLRDKLRSVFLETGLNRFILVAATYNQALRMIRE